MLNIHNGLMHYGVPIVDSPVKH